MKNYGSADFARVPDSLRVDMPQRLLHPDVINSTHGDTDHAFSQERKHLVRVVDLPSRILSMTIGGLQPGQSTRRHRHNYETIIYVLSGSGKSVVEDREIQWQAGDAFYIPVWAWHQHSNLSSTQAASYLACESAALLQNLGIALREEA